MRKIFLIFLIFFSLIITAESTISVEELSSILGYQENLHYPVSEFFYGETNQYLKNVILENDIEQLETYDYFLIVKDFAKDYINAISTGWKMYFANHSDAETSLKLYLQYYESVISEFEPKDSQTIVPKHFLYLNNLSVFLHALGLYDYYVDINNFLIANMKFLNQSVSAFAVKSYIYINRACIKLIEKDYIGATHYFYLAHLVNSDQKQDILTLSDVQDKQLREIYKQTKYFEILKTLLETPSIIKISNN